MLARSTLPPETFEDHRSTQTHETLSASPLPHPPNLKKFVYPKIPTLSIIDTNHVLEFLYQNQWIPSSYDMPYGGPPPLWGQAPSFSHRSQLCTPEGLPSLGRPMGIALGSSNGTLLSSTQN